MERHAEGFPLLSDKEKRSRIARLRAHRKPIIAMLERFISEPELLTAAEDLLAALDAEIEKYGGK